MSSLSKRVNPFDNTKLGSAAPNDELGVELMDRLVDRVVARITPFFQADAGFPQATAQEAARQLLTSYNAGTGKELQLAGQIAAFGMAVLNCLSCSMGEPEMPVSVILRMRTDAIKLNNMSTKCTKMLHARQRERASGQALSLEATQFNEAEFNTAIGKARDMVTDARTKQEIHRVSIAPGNAPAASPAPEKPALRPQLAEPMTPEVLIRCNNTEPSWAAELNELARTTGLTKH